MQVQVPDRVNAACLPNSAKVHFRCHGHDGPCSFSLTSPHSLPPADGFILILYLIIQLPLNLVHSLSAWTARQHQPHRNTMAQPYETTSRLNYFFTHLNHDVRHMIYDFLDLPPISVSCLGLVLCCRQAMVETRPAAAQQLKRRLAAAEAMARKEGRHFFIPKTEEKLEYVSLGRIEIVACSRSYTMESNGIHMLLSCCFSKIKIVCLSQADY